MARTRRPSALATLFVALFALGTAEACSTGGAGCGCALPAEAPLGEEAIVYDGMQAYLTPAAFDFISGNFDQILQQFVAGGLSFPVPGGTYETLFGLISIDYCGGAAGAGCTITANIDNIWVERLPPNLMRLNGQLDVTGTVDIRGTVDCDIPITITDKPVALDVVLLVDPLTKALDFALGDNLALQLTASDFSLEGGWLCDVGDFLTDVLIPLFQGQIDTFLRDQVKTMAADQIDAFTCMACDTYSATGCFAGSSCAGTPDWCRPGGDAAQACVAKYQGMEGKIDVSSVLGGLTGGGAAATPNPANAKLQILVAPGQRNQPAQQPYIAGPAAGLRINVITGIEGQQDPCVPVCEAPGCTPPPVDAPPPIDFDAEAARQNIANGAYMLGLGASDRFLDKAAFEAWKSGAICLAIDSSTSSLISTNTFSTFLGSLSSLTERQNAPMRIAVRPGQAPAVRIGAGTYTTNAEGQTVIDEPLLTLALHDLSLDFYALGQDRWIRLFTLTVDVDLPLALQFTPDNQVIPIIGDLGGAIANIRATNSEILAEDPGLLADLVPSIIGLATPALASGLAPIAIPEVQGFKPVVRAVAGIVPRQGEPGTFEHLGIFADLELLAPGGSPMRAAPQGRLQLVELSYPRGAERVVVDGKLRKAFVVLAPERLEETREVQWRVDGGLWSPFTKEGVLTVRDPVLNLPGRHVIELRGRTIGDYHTLDAEPQRIEAIVDFTAPSLEVAEDARGRLAWAEATDDLTLPETLSWRFLVDGVWITSALQAQDPELVEAVEVIDESGNASRHDFPAVARRAVSLAVAEAGGAPVTDGAQATSGCGCSAGEGASASLAGLLAGLFALVTLRRARR